MNNSYRQIVLLILDGWGYAPDWGGNAISASNTPVFSKLWKEYPHTILCSSGECVGLPGHERGNSEVGHLNIGSGRVVKQDSSNITDAISNGTFFENQEFINAINHAKKNNSNLHLIGLVSDGGIHSHIDHLYALLELCKKQSFTRVFIDVFTDGRDTEPMSSLSIISRLEDKLKKIGIGKISSISGRYFAMDRDNHWERINQAYIAMVEGIGATNTSALSTISHSYNEGVTDEFIQPTIMLKNNKPISLIQDNDSVIFFNFRSDRAREITLAFISDNMTYFSRRKKLSNLYFVGLIPYGYEKELRVNLKSAFSQGEIHNPLAEVLSANNLKQFHIAETEKYAHVTYFFNGGREKQFKNEDRLLIPSPRIPSYDLVPEMSLLEVNKNAIQAIKSRKYAFSVINYANADMVGHTGNFKAAIQACETIDTELGNLCKAIIDKKAILLVTADHGNIEQMVNPKTGEPDTEHTRNPVPFILFGDKSESIKDIAIRQGGILADIAPTILDGLEILQPSQLSGKTLLARL